MKKLLKKKVIICFLFLIALGNLSYAQSYNYYSVNTFLGGNYGWRSQTLGIGAGVALNLRQNQFLYSIEFKHAEEFDLGFGLGSRSNYKYSTLSLLAGIRKGSKFFKYDLQAGIGLINGYSIKLRNSTYDWDFGHKTGVNVMAKIAGKFVPSKKFAIGLEAQLGVGSVTSYHIIPALSLEIGDIRD